MFDDVLLDDNMIINECNIKDGNTLNMIHTRNEHFSENITNSAFSQLETRARKLEDVLSVLCERIRDSNIEINKIHNNISKAEYDLC